MRAFKISLGVLFLLVPILCSSELKVTVLKNSEILPENFCNIWEKGDYLVSDGIFHAIIGGVSRPLYSSLNVPVGDARGCLISFVPGGKKLVSDLNIGSPVLRIKKKSTYIPYSTVHSKGGPSREKGLWWCSKCYLHGEMSRQQSKSN